MFTLGVFTFAGVIESAGYNNVYGAAAPEGTIPMSEDAGKIHWHKTVEKAFVDFCFGTMHDVMARTVIAAASYENADGENAAKALVIHVCEGESESSVEVVPENLHMFEVPIGLVATKGEKYSAGCDTSNMDDPNPLSSSALGFENGAVLDTVSEYKINGNAANPELGETKPIKFGEHAPGTYEDVFVEDSVGTMRDCYIVIVIAITADNNGMSVSGSALHDNMILVTDVDKVAIDYVVPMNAHVFIEAVHHFGSIASKASIGCLTDTGTPLPITIGKDVIFEDGIAVVMVDEVNVSSVDLDKSPLNI